MRQYVITLPDSLLDAARIDGASEPGIFFRICLASCKPVLSVLAISPSVLAGILYFGL